MAVNDVTMDIGPGVTGLLGPNGAGKSTILHMIAGFPAPSKGTLALDGAPTWKNPEIYRRLGLVPERDSVYAFLTGAQFVTATAKLHKLPDPERSAAWAIGLTEMAEAQDRKISTYSKGMRQRIKVAAALVHDPEILLLDEPFNGMDPRQRLHMMDLLSRLGDEGRTILFSSHILEEVERLSGTIQVMVAGRLAASGDFRAIRRLMTSRPHVFHVKTTDDRRLAAALVGRDYTHAVELTGNGLQVRTSDFGAFSRADRGHHPRREHPADRVAAHRRVAGKRLRLPDRELGDSAMLNPVIAGITVRATLGRRRAVLFTVPAVVLIALTLVLRASHPAGASWPANVLGTFGFSVLLPLTALIIGTGVLGAEIDDGSVVHLLATPVRRRDRDHHQVRGRGRPRPRCSPPCPSWSRACSRRARPSLPGRCSSAPWSAPWSTRRPSCSPRY